MPKLGPNPSVRPTVWDVIVLVLAAEPYAVRHETGVYGLGCNGGSVSVGIDHGTAQFSAVSIRRWWAKMGFNRFAHAESCSPQRMKGAATAAIIGSGSNRCRNWRNYLNLTLEVRHLSPDASKLDKREHNFFCFMTEN